jgi:hypothetical protein
MSQREFLESIGNAAQVGSLLIAILALIVATYALRRNRILQRETIAANIWREYEKTALSYPRYC